MSKKAVIHPSCPIRRQTGQSLIEGLVGLMAMVPLLMGVIGLARLIDLQQATVSAAREAAFECTVMPAGCPVGPGPDPAALTAFSRDSRALWRDAAGQTLPLDRQTIQTQWEALRFDTPFAFAGGTASQSVPGAVHLLSNLAGPGRFGLSLDGGLSRAQVVVALPAWRIGGLGSTIERGSTPMVPLRIEAKLAVLSDDWMARSPEGAAADSVRTRVEAGQRVPGVDAALRAGWWPIRGLLQLAAWVGLESSAERFTPYVIDVDRVPPDRLGLSPWPRPPTPEPELPALDPGGSGWIQDGA